MPCPKLAYLYSRYPVVSQTFCDSEMLALESMGRSLVVGSLYPPKDSFRHERLEKLRAPVHYPPPQVVLKAMQAAAEADGTWPTEMVARHERDYGPSFQSAVRARNALWFARLFTRLGVGHVHVHFANRATHTALFLKAISSIPFSFTPHAQDFMVDLGSDALLAELCREATHVVTVSDFSLGLLREKCPESAGKMCRVYNGIALNAFPAAPPRTANDGPLRILSTGRLIEFKGFHHLIMAMAQLRDKGVPATLRIIGDGPLSGQLESLVAELALGGQVSFLGARSQDAVMAELAASDVFALACTVDGKGASDILPTVIAEAMACGLPVVSTRLAGVPEMVVHGETGLLAEPGDVDGLADNLMALHAEPALAARLGHNGRTRAEACFALDVTSREFSNRLDAAGFPLPGKQDAASVTSRVWLVPSWPVPDDLKIEADWVRQQPGDGFLAMVAGKQSSDAPCDRVDFLPDGMVLEAAWRARPDHAARCEAIRNELGAAVDGERFFQWARRAAWLASEAPKRGISRLHGSRAAETIVAWLAHELSGIPFSGVLDPDHRLDEKWVTRMAACATRLVDSRRDDFLGLISPQPARRQWGPIRWKSATHPIPPAERHRALDRLFK